MNPQMLARMSRDQRRLHQATLNEQTFRVNLEAALKQRDAEKVHYYREALAECLIMQGKLDEAHECVKWKKGCSEIARRAREAKIAETLDDADRCNCADEVIDVPINPGTRSSKTKPVKSSRYVARRRYFSQTHNDFVTIYRCIKCGHKQAITGPIDELTAAADQARIDFPGPKEGADAQVMLSV